MNSLNAVKNVQSESTAIATGGDLESNHQRTDTNQMCAFIKNIKQMAEHYLR